jgi:hypothetical protein
VNRSLCALLIAPLFAGCGGDDGATKAECPPGQVPVGEVGACAPTAIDEGSGPGEVKMVKLEIVGDVTVASSSYGTIGPNGEEATGYEAVVIFRVRNPNDVPVTGAPYRVEMLAGTESVGVSDGTDTLSANAGETHVVVFEYFGEIYEEPTDAKITTYALPALEDVAPLPTGEDWEVTNQRLNCNTGGVACDATGDFTWKGDHPQPVAPLMIAIHRGNLNGPIVAGGVAILSHDPTGVLQPGQTLPFTAPIRGPFQPEASVSPVLPDYEIKGEFYVDWASAVAFYGE